MQEDEFRYSLSPSTHFTFTDLDLPNLHPHLHTHGLTYQKRPPSTCSLRGHVLTRLLQHLYFCRWRSWLHTRPGCLVRPTRLQRIVLIFSAPVMFIWHFDSCDNIIQCFSLDLRMIYNSSIMQLDKLKSLLRCKYTFVMLLNIFKINSETWDLSLFLINCFMI